MRKKTKQGIKTMLMSQFVYKIILETSLGEKTLSCPFRLMILTSERIAVESQYRSNEFGLSEE